jgi:hypothetical protein
VPSGDQVGCQSNCPGFVVSLVGAEPSAFMTQISKLPERSLVKAIFVPSGDHAGWSSVAALFVMLT